MNWQGALEFDLKKQGCTNLALWAGLVTQNSLTEGEAYRLTAMDGS